MRSTNFILLLLLPFISFSQSFHLEGKFSGKNTDSLVLRYFDIDGNYVTDTIKIENGEFQTTGEINGVEKVLLIGDTQSGRMEDPNLGYFFLEPGNIEVQLEEDHFKNINVMNSETQKEFEKVNKKSSAIRAQIDRLLKSGRKDLVRAKLKEIRNLELGYAAKHPYSPLSAYYINFYQRRISQDSLKNYYENLSPNIQKTVYGNAIKELLDKRILSSGDQAPDFEIRDLNGKKLSLESFHGKYLLIDFWAGWCVPCIKKLPQIRSLVKKYSNQDLEVLFVSFDQTEDNWRKAVKKNDLAGWTNIFIGLDNIKKKESLSYKLDIQPIPAYILIGPDGKVIGRYAGASKNADSINELSNKLETLME